MLTPLAPLHGSFSSFFREAGFTHEQFKQESGAARPAVAPPWQSAGSAGTHFRALAVERLVALVFPGRAAGERGHRGACAGTGDFPDAGNGNAGSQRGPLDPHGHADAMRTLSVRGRSGRTLESPESSGMVLWPNPSTRLLQMFTIRRPSGATLDLGAGCGILAILASGHSRQVVATDLNPRATEFARFNVWLNGVKNVDCLTGDTFQPVQGRTFDLIVSNPPFFVTPSTGQIYCENSMELDGYCRELDPGGAALS